MEASERQIMVVIFSFQIYSPKAEWNILFWYVIYLFSLFLSFFVFFLKSPAKHFLIWKNKSVNPLLRVSVLFCAGKLLDQLIFKLHNAKSSSTCMLHQDAVSTSAVLSSTQDGFEVTLSADCVKWRCFCDFWSPKRCDNLPLMNIIV